jgi:ribosomal-protein-alanine N-acetyltransferase
MRIDSPPDSGCPGFILRPISREDLEPWYAYLALPEVFQHTSWNLSSQNDLLPLFDFFESTAVNSARRMALIDEKRQVLAGTIGFHTVSDVNRSAEIAYDLSPSYWGRGMATTICDVVTSWAFEHYGFNRVQGTVLETNSRSEAVLRRCSFSFEGLLRDYRSVRGAPGNFKMYARLKAD